MKILHVVQGYWPAIGGTEFLIKNISENLVKKYGDEVTVFTTNAYNCEAFNTFGNPLMPSGEELINGVKVKRFPIFNKLAPLLNVMQKIFYHFKLPYNSYFRTLYQGPIVFKMLPALIRADGDLIVASSFPLMHMHYASLASRINKKPLVFIGGLHPEDRWGFDRSSIFKAIKRADACVAYTNFEKDFLIKKGIDSGKIEVIGVGTDPHPFFEARGEKFRLKYGINGDPLIAFVGQQGGHKGIETLLLAMKLVWKRIPEAIVVIAGARTNYSPYLDSLLSTFKNKEREKIIMLETFDEEDKPEIMAACDVFASPSGYESFGITFLEAWSAQKPVVGCRSGAIPSVIDEGQDGLLVEYRDWQELASVLVELLFDDRLRARVGKKGREKVLANYTWEIVTRKYRDLYTRVLG